MSKARAFSTGLWVVCMIGLLAPGCGQMDGDLRNDPLVSPKGAPKDIFDAAADGDLERVREIMASGNWDPTEMDNRAMRPLDYAVRGGNPEVVRLMVQYGADVHVPGPEGTPLEVARKRGRKEVEQVLLDMGARQ